MNALKYWLHSELSRTYTWLHKQSNILSHIIWFVIDCSQGQVGPDEKVLKSRLIRGHTMHALHIILTLWVYVYKESVGRPLPVLHFYFIISRFAWNELKRWPSITKNVFFSILLMSVQQGSRTGKNLHMRDWVQILLVIDRGYTFEICRIKIITCGHWPCPSEEIPLKVNMSPSSKSDISMIMLWRSQPCNSDSRQG